MFILHFFFVYTFFFIDFCDDVVLSIQMRTNVYNHHSTDLHIQRNFIRMFLLTNNTLVLRIDKSGIKPVLFIFNGTV
jgi:hypothetical protein